MPRTTSMSVRDLITELLQQVDDLDREISITTDADQTPGWTDYVITTVDFSMGGDTPVIEASLRA
jgi:hypothetical protein